MPVLTDTKLKPSANQNNTKISSVTSPGSGVRGHSRPRQIRADDRPHIAFRQLTKSAQSAAGR